MENVCNRCLFSIPSRSQESPHSSPEELERLCKTFGDSIDVSKLFVCPEQLKDLLLKKKVIKINTLNQKQLQKASLPHAT